MFSDALFVTAIFAFLILFLAVTPGTTLTSWQFWTVTASGFRHAIHLQGKRPKLRVNAFTPSPASLQFGRSRAAKADGRLSETTRQNLSRRRLTDTSSTATCRNLPSAKAVQHDRNKHRRDGND